MRKWRHVGDGWTRMWITVGRMYEWTVRGSPRLASALYRDYICKTIRLNHFLNKRILSSPVAGTGDGTDTRLLSNTPSRIKGWMVVSRGGSVRATKIFRSTYATCFRISWRSRSQILPSPRRSNFIHLFRF